MENKTPQISAFGIVLQVQPTNKTCVQTCLAMALGEPVQKVIDYYGEEAMNQELLTYALTECKILWNQFINGTMIYQGWYFVVVPSLNRKGVNHQILVRWNSNDGLTVMDPAINNTYNSDGSDLISFESLTPFIPGGILPIKK